MKDEYDFSAAKKNPYAKKLKQQVTINLDVDAVEYFKELAARYGIPYQTLINLFLADCVKNKKEPTVNWN